MSSRYITLDEITIPANRIRNVVTDLGPSLQEHGQLLPVVVYAERDALVLKDGLQRLDAARRLGWERIWAVEVPSPTRDDQSLLEQYEINHARTGLSYLDQARVWQALIASGKWTQIEIARHFKISTAKVSLALSTLQADPIVQDLVDQGKLAPSAVRALLPLTSKKQRQLAPAAARARTVQGVYDLVRADQLLDSLETNSPTDLNPSGTEEDPDLDLLMQTDVQGFNLALLEEARSLLQDILDSNQSLSRAESDVASQIIILANQVLGQSDELYRLQYSIESRDRARLADARRQ